MSLVFLLGGARSGKSRLAVQLAGTRSPVTFLATGEARDEEMADRIARHRAERPAEWLTHEEPHYLVTAIRDTPSDHVLLVDCLSLWVSNLIETTDAESIMREATDAARLAASRASSTIAVSNEVGLGLVPTHPLGRAYRDLLGRVNAIWAEAADEAYLVVAGRLLPLQAAAEVRVD